MKKIIVASIIATSLLSTGCSTDYSSIEINISAASSLKDVMIEVKDIYEKENEDVKLIINYGGSGSLKTQIENGAPCDMFISASNKEIEVLKDKELVKDEHVKNIASNELVLITHKDNEINKVDDLMNDKVMKIGQGNPDSVPVGMYADEYLINEGIKKDLETKMVYGKNVKEVLAWVKTQNADVGFVYNTDIVNDEEIKIVSNIPSDSHSDIEYPSAIISDTKYLDEIIKLQEFMLSKDGQDILEKYGYIVN